MTAFARNASLPPAGNYRALVQVIEPSPRHLVTSSPRHLVTSSYHRALVQVMAWYHIMTVITSSPHHLIISSHHRVLVQAAAIMDEAMAGGEPVPPTQQRVLALLSEKTVCRISS
jgi:hypothetical protein